MSVSPGTVSRTSNSLRVSPFLGACALRFHWARAWGIALLMVSGLATPSALAQLNAPLTLEEAERLALAAEPGQRALLSRADALREQSVAAGQLPDPKVRLGIANFPIQSGGFTTEGMTQAQIGVRQVFPPGRTRSVRTRQFEFLAAELSENADGRARDVRTAVRHAWLETYYWDGAETIVRDSRALFSDMVTVTRSLYAVGRKDQQDVLRADLELSRLDDRLIGVTKQLARARAALSEWVGDSAVRPMAPSLPAWEEVPELALLEQQLQTHPALTAADARIEAREAGVQLARERYKPGWVLDVGYSYRDGSLPNGKSRPDFVSAMVTFDLPLFRANRQDRELAGALSERSAADESRDQLRRRLLSQLESEYARWQELSRRIDLYERLIIGQAHARAQAALAAYQSEASDFNDVMRGYIDELDTRLAYLRLRVERAQSYAVLANLGGIQP